MAEKTKVPGKKKKLASKQIMRGAAAQTKATAEKGTNLALVPPVPTLQLAVVAVLDRRMDEVSKRLNLSSDKLRKAALYYRELCRGGACFSCGEPLTAEQLASLDEKRVDDMLPCTCFNKLRDGYVEHSAGWRRKIPQMIKDIKSFNPKAYDPDNTAKFAPFTVLFSDKCGSCKKRFDTTADTVVRLIEKHGNFEPYKRCKPCGLKRRDDVRRAIPGSPVAAKPQRRSTQTLSATVAERVESKTEATG